MNKPKIYIGTAGWKYEDWIGSFYPKKESSGFDWLSFYSHYFNCVEVNSTYYAYISDKVAGAWIRKTEGLDDFIFILKLHQDFTHKRNYTNKNIEDVNNILHMMKKAGRLGGLLIQFPQSFKFDENSAAYITGLNEIFGQYNIFLEVRHGSFHTKDAVDFFHSAGINCVTIDQPEIGNAIGFKPILTCSSLYFRLHGRNKEDWFKGFDKSIEHQSESERSARYNYMYTPGELVEIAEEVKLLFTKAETMFIITNNHPKGNAVANAFQLMYMLENRKMDIPPNTLMHYPRLKNITKSAAGTFNF